MKVQLRFVSDHVDYHENHLLLLVRKLDEDPSAIPSDGIATATPSVIEVLADFDGVANDGVRATALHVDNEADSTVLTLIPRIVKTLSAWKS